MTSSENTDYIRMLKFIEKIADADSEKFPASAIQSEARDILGWDQIAVLKLPEDRDQCDRCGRHTNDLIFVQRGGYDFVCGECQFLDKVL